MSPFSLPFSVIFQHSLTCRVTIFISMFASQFNDFVIINCNNFFSSYLGMRNYFFYLHFSFFKIVHYVQWSIIYNVFLSLLLFWCCYCCCGYCFCCAADSATNVGVDMNKMAVALIEKFTFLLLWFLVILCFAIVIAIFSYSPYFFRFVVNETVIIVFNVMFMDVIQIKNIILLPYLSFLHSF